MPAICALISSVARLVWPASALTSPATTAKPRPASPARAASMVALSASRLVCSAISVISLTTSPMRAAASPNSLTARLVWLGFVHRLGGDGVGLRHLPVDLVDRCRQLVGGRRNVADIGGSLGRRGVGARGLGRGIVGGAGQAGSMLPASDRRCGRDRPALPRPRRRSARFPSPSSPAGRRAIAASSITVRLSASLLLHGLLENADRARQRADLVAAVAERDRDTVIALGDDFGHARDFATAA